jgi:predicted transposase/invertase (TIGR01784 family)
MWSAFFQFASDPNPAHRDFVNNIIEMKEEIDMASTLLMEISKDEQERARFRSRRMAETDRISNLLTVEERGRTRGRTEGRAEALIGVAKNLRAGGMGVDDIAKATGLTVDDILRL